MKHCILLLLFSIPLFLTTTSHAIRIKFSSAPSTSTQHHLQPLHSWANSPITSRGRNFEFQKRTVPTGSNPLHNKR
ncbi:hypothetical protein PHAVU_006G006600 [Phaseolus vulgaris]|uniref:Uncharacterized protein n=1 Tax=Phaseolus vulgaris TaxID=3885 RepID=V7BJ50_PHAVU|nr:hypothetical protein PHAVU_006G006600g [Phaseolus vulgaris]ESW18019.1 hypothetical protein PHAVU_006G006600g [Phaseolus vulgaris]